MLPEDERVICSIKKNFILPEQKNVIMHLHKVQEQIGSNDCGALAIAFASSLACGLNPTCCSYKQENLRAELAKVFTSKLFHPLEKITNRKSKPKNIEINLYCTCRLNHIPHKIDVKENMITCDRCGECMNLLNASDLEEVREEGRQFQIRGSEKAKADLAKECLTDKTKKLLEKEDWRSTHIGFILLKISVSI
ncbi:hypothetical protein HELRODRAFT_174390 [Helobdella robusta]|uniref:Ubiquitin-like protease family profile domain-containing protein n=1 Tax=Helobdella robusta TaxID=6412 RepID=T1F828_HELRO|nr:hypothetical protein HELRODRAFT_174390 [Helobdella robusta]ESO02923.1 hypothetical protein HELRODRAFT_174390 [Helobdella robusta]